MDNTIHFFEWVYLIMVSNDQANSVESITHCYWCDEAVLLDQERLFNNVQTTNRSYLWRPMKINHFVMLRYMHLLAAMTQKGQWFTDLEVLAGNRGRFCL
jgi:hypothetical protein